MRSHPNGNDALANDTHSQHKPSHRNNPRMSHGERGAVLAAALTFLGIAIFISSQIRSGFAPVIEYVTAIGGGFVTAAIAWVIVTLALKLLRRSLSQATRMVIGAMAATAFAFCLATTLTFGTFLMGFIIAVPMVGAAALLGGAIGYGRQHGFGRPLAIVWIAAGFLLCGAVTFWLANPGVDAPAAVSPQPGAMIADNTSEPGLPGESGPAEESSRAEKPAPFDDPDLPGAYGISALHYGSGINRQRPEFGADVDITTPTVDFSSYLSEWASLGGRLRTSYWGFGPDELPLNAQVWYPQTSPDGALNSGGPFPLVLIAHGNHRMSEYADPGFAYIGEHLASRGFIVASVDANFVNGSLYGEFSGRENPVRAKLLLEHLAQWRAWSDTPGHPFEGVVDMERIALIGHSRGGEATSLAVAYNHLPFDPTDATEPFDYGFSIRSLAGLAPVDSMYEPADRPIPVQGVNYLLITGMHDADVGDLSGGRTFERVQLDDGQLKASLHMHRANHSQFNTTRPTEDLPLPFGWLINRRPIMAAGDQRRATLIYLNAFLEATLNDDAKAAAFLQDRHAAVESLPHSHYVAHYVDSSHHTVANFAEDLDVTTTTAPGGRIVGTGLTQWRETILPTAYTDGSNFGTFIAWDAEADPTPPSLAFVLPEDANEEWPIDDETVFVMSLVDARSSAENPEPLHFSVRLTFTDGTDATLPLDRFGTLAPTPPVKRLKLGFLENTIMGEPLLPQQFEIPIAAFAERAGVPANTARSIQLVFDMTPMGSLYVDEIAIARRVGELY